MERRDFIKKGCQAGIAVIGICMLPMGCKTTSILETDGKITIPLSSFKNENLVAITTTNTHQRILIRKLDETNYTAMSLRCTHKGAELKLEKEHLVCPSHGSIFDLEGKVSNGPAKRPLPVYETKVNAGNLEVILIEKG